MREPRVGQTPGATQRCPIRESAGEFSIRDERGVRSDRAKCALKIMHRVVTKSAIQFTVHSAMVEMSLTKIRLPEIDGAGHVALLATV
jgi:hypothetical protein